jgi:hypothetical protein
MAQMIPGIIVRIQDDAGIIAPPLYARYPVIIGEGDPWRLVSDVETVRSTGSVDDLVHSTDIHEIVSVGDLPGIVNYVKNVDYQLFGTGRISWISPNRPNLGDSYFITFTDTRAASAYEPTLYFDENLVFADHGWKTRTNGNINDVSVGASQSFLNGAKGVITAQLDLTSAVDPDAPTVIELEAAFTAVITKLEEITEAKLFLVGMSSGVLSTVTAANILFNHAVLASQPARKQERTVIMAMPMNTTYQDYAAIAAAYAHERMMVPAIPTSLKVTGFTADYDDRYYNAGLAGKLCSVDIGRTIHDEIIAGVTIADNFTLNTQNYLVQHSVSPVKAKGGIVRNIMANTTNGTSALTEDLGVQDVKDYVRNYWRVGLWNIYKNAPITSSLIGAVTGSSNRILDYLKGKSIISDAQNVTCTQDKAEPRKLLLSASIQPAYGMAYMDVTFTFVLTF